MIWGTDVTVQAIVNKVARLSRSLTLSQLDQPVVACLVCPALPLDFVIRQSGA